jgi:hypothetical protein
MPMGLLAFWVSGKDELTTLAAPMDKGKRQDQQISLNGLMK